MRRSPIAVPSGAEHGAGSAPGKIILFGEHAVVYGQPALGVPIERRVVVRLAPGRGRVRLTLAPGLRAPRGAPRATPRALVEAALGERLARVDVTIELGVPPMSGLGSSAALAVALLRAAGARGSRTALLARALAVEEVAHGRASGVDPAIALWGRPILFRRDGERRRVRAFRFARPIHLVVGAAGSHGGTKATVSALALLRAEAPGLVGSAMAALGEATRSGARALAQGELTLAGKAMDLAHGVLSGLGLVAWPVEAAVRAARAAGALGAKMSGAGGQGGALVALAADEAGARRISRRLGELGVDAWAEPVG